MNDDQIADLKQFIATTISQQTAHLATKDDVAEAVGNLQARMNQRFDELQAAIGEAISESNESADTQLTDHEQRITALERHFA